MKLYRLLTGPDDSAFCARVEGLLNRGWQLHGSPSIASVDGRGYVAQASKRSLGFLIQALACAVLLFGALGRIVYLLSISAA